VGEGREGGDEQKQAIGKNNAERRDTPKANPKQSSHCHKPASAYAVPDGRPAVALGREEEHPRGEPRQRDVVVRDDLAGVRARKLLVQNLHLQQVGEVGGEEQSERTSPVTGVADDGRVKARWAIVVVEQHPQQHEPHDHRVSEDDGLGDDLVVGGGGAAERGAQQQLLKGEEDGRDEGGDGEDAPKGGEPHAGLARREAAVAHAGRRRGEQVDGGRHPEAQEGEGGNAAPEHGLKAARCKGSGRSELGGSHGLWQCVSTHGALLGRIRCFRAPLGRCWELRKVSLQRRALVKCKFLGP